MPITGDMPQTTKGRLKPTISGYVLGVTKLNDLSDSDQAKIRPRLRAALTQDVFLRDQRNPKSSRKELYSAVQSLSMGELTQGRPSHGIAAMFNGDALKAAGTISADKVPDHSKILKVKGSNSFDYSQLSGSERLYQYLAGKNGLFSKNPQLGKELYKKLKEGAEAEQSDEEICTELRTWYNDNAAKVTEALGKDDELRVARRAAMFRNFIQQLPTATDAWKAKEGKLLDVGCSGMEGTRSMVSGLLKADVQVTQVYGIDIYRAPSLEHNRAEIGKLKTSSGKPLQALPLLYEGVDHSKIPSQAQDSKIITAMSVLHHVVDSGQLDKLLGSVRQNLADDGIFIVRELIADDMSTKIFNLIPELKFYRAFEQLPVPMDVNCYKNVDQWKKAIERNGFKLIAIEHNPQHPFEPAMMAFRKR
jgi:hypothetical protein